MDKRGQVGIGVLVALGAILLATRPAKGATGEAAVAGQVLDQANMPLSEVSVTLGGWNTSTNINGSFAFSNIAPGTYAMSFAKAGYETAYL